MVGLYFGDLVYSDIVMAACTGVLGSIVLAVAYHMSAKGVPKWKPRKLVHITMGSVIGITILGYSNLSGPSLAVGLFLTVLLYAWAHKSTLIMELLVAGSRENESRLNTFASGFMGMLSFGIVFLFFLSKPEVIVSAILAVSWGDAAGEVFGRSYGGKVVGRRFRGKSLEGSFGVFIFTLVGQIVAISIYSTEICPLCVLPQLVLISFAIALVEILAIGWSDNFLIPLVTALLMWILLFPNMVFFPL